VARNSDSGLRPGEALCTTSWTCCGIAGCAAVLAVTLTATARDPFDRVGLLASLVFLLGTWGGGALGVVCGLLGLASRDTRQAKPLRPLLANLAVVIGFTLAIWCFQIGPTHHGAPGGF